MPLLRKIQRFHSKKSLLSNDNDAFAFIGLSGLKILLNRFAQVRREMLWVVIGQILAFSGGFAGIKILTNVMRPEDYGQLALGMTIAGLMNMFVFGPISQIVIRFFSAYHERNELSLYFYLLKKAHKVSIVFLITLAIIVGAFVYILAGSEWSLLVMMASLFGVVTGVNGSYLSLQSAIRQRKVVALHQGADAWLRPVLAVSALYLFTNSGYSALLGYLLGTFIIILSQRLFALQNNDIRSHWYGKSPDKNVERNCFKEFFAYGSSFTAFAVFAAISMYSDRWILLGLFGEREVGIYAAIYQIANAPLTLLIGMVYQLMVPIIFERAGAMTFVYQVESSTQLLRLTIMISSFMMLIVVLITFYWSESLVQILTTESFAQYHQSLWVITLGLCFHNIAQILFLKGQNYKKPRIYLPAWALRSIVFIFIGFIFTKYFGIIGMAWGFCLTSFLFLVAVYATNLRLISGKITS